MTTSGTSTFNLDLNNIIEEAFERCGAELRTGYDLRTARRSLNLLTIEWANRGINLWTVEQGSIPLVQGQITYDLPADTIDLIEHVVRTQTGQAQTDININRISVDSDTSTSDTVVAVSSGRVPCPDLAAFEAALEAVCSDLAEDVVRNGEGVRHVLRVRISGAPDESVACALGKAIVNAPLFKCAMAGNDPNVGRLVQAIGKHVGAAGLDLDLSRLRARIGGQEIFAGGAFRLDYTKEAALVAHLRDAELYASRPGPDGVFSAPVDYPPHERCVEIEADLAAGPASAVVYGGDLTHEYVSENADYRS